MSLMRIMLVSVFLWCVTGQAIGEVIVPHNPVVDIVSGWADGTIEASASGYNNGSVMNPGRHWASADDFIIPDASSLPWQIDRLSFVCGTDLNAAVDTYRVSVYADDNGKPVGWDDYLWRYEEASDSPVSISVTQTFAGGTQDRWLHEVAVDTSSFDLLLESNTNYYISIEGDCVNIDDVYNGYDTYYQRFYMLSGIDTDTSAQINNNHWFTGKYDSIWSSWEEADSDLIWTIEGHQIPEPCTVFLLGLGGLGLIRRRRN